MNTQQPNAKDAPADFATRHINDTCKAAAKRAIARCVYAKVTLEFDDFNTAQRVCSELRTAGMRGAELSGTEVKIARHEFEQCARLPRLLAALAD